MDLRALVVCPDQESASVLTVVLSELSMEAEHTASLTRGLELLDSERFDAIILDYRADPASEAFLAHLRQSGKNRTTMLIAVVDADFNARPVFGLGANFVLYRPLSSERTRISLRAARGLMQRERRRAPRTPINSKVSIAYPGAPEFSAVLTDLSDTGTLLKTDTRIPSGCKIYFEFSLPGQKQVVRLSGEVAWQDWSGRTGIRFLDLPQSSRRMIQTWLQNNVPAVRTLTTQPTTPPVSRSPFVEKSSLSESFDLEPSGDEGIEKSPAPQVRKKDAVLVSNAGNRRGELRVACKLGAEVYRLGTSVPNRCTLSDISEGGCYVEMPSPLTGQAVVEILVRTADTKLRIRGQVLATHPGFGMGVRFVFRDTSEREEIMRLLAVLAAGPSLNEQHR